ncbi:MAG TPA: ester cyclase [Thermomicrobiales bacterium]|nr:ester cyclase [Thermomicrobiales bacterium]
MTVKDDNVAIVWRMFEDGMGGNDLDAAVRDYAPGLIYHNPVLKEMPFLPGGTAGMKALMAATRAAFPDMTCTVETIVANADQVALMYSWTGTHVGALGPVAPTGRTITATGAIFCRLERGKIVEQWDIDDRLGVMQQMGLIPTPEAAGAV